MLLDAGADVNAKSDAGGTPLDAALKGSHDAAATLLRARGAKAGSGKLE
jgi:ankyrin repeat protein